VRTCLRFSQKKFLTIEWPSGSESMLQLVAVFVVNTKARNSKAILKPIMTVISIRNEPITTGNQFNEVETFMHVLSINRT